MILIVGGSGILGSLVARRLLDERQPVRVMSRTPERAVSLRAAGAEVVSGDLLDRESVVRACQGATAVVGAAHSLFGRGRHASVHVDGTAHRQLIDIARAAGVRHFVYTSVYDYGEPYRAVPFFRIKFEVEEYLKSSGLRWTILRPTAFMDVHAHVLIGQPILTKGRVVLFGRGEQPRNFVAAQDVAQVVTRVLRDAAYAGQTVDVAGPENLTHMDVVRVYERASGRPAKITRVPLGIPRAASILLRPVHPGVSQLLQAAVLADTTEPQVDGQRVMSRLGLEPTRLEEWVSGRVQRAHHESPRA